LMVDAIREVTTERSNLGTFLKLTLDCHFCMHFEVTRYSLCSSRKSINRRQF